MRLPQLARRAAAPALAAAAFLAGLSVDHVASARDEERWRALDVFAQVLAHVENQYVDPVDERELVYGAVDGMLGKLDAHTVFLRPDVYRAMREETAGEFEGVGLELAERGEALVVVAPLAESPAERAGIRSGDRIVEIDGRPARDTVEAMRRLKGPVGTTVRLSVLRDGFRAPQVLALVRDRIRLQAVEWRAADRERRLVVVRVKLFQERTDRALKHALDAARAELHGELGGVVLDLRGNPGGLLDQAVRVADRFLDAGVIVSTEGRGRKPEVERAHEKETEPRYPLAVLVDQGSASASEIVAGALQDHHRATIVGATSFGKGSVQQIVDLPDGSGLKLTVARYYTPDHRSIQDRGIVPDVRVAGARARDGGAGSAAVADPQLDAALAALITRPGQRSANGPTSSPPAAAAPAPR